MPLLVLAACSNTTYTRENIPGDEANAVVFCKKYYQRILHHEQDSAYAMMNRYDIDNDKFAQLTAYLDSAFGPLKSFHFVKTLRTKLTKKNAMETGEYELQFSAQYEKAETTESFVLESNGDQMEIKGYNVKQK